LTLSVVVPTRERRSLLPDVLAPLLSDSRVDQIVVVVDGSTDGSLEWLREKAVTEPRLLTLGLARRGGAQVARAQGLDRATGDVVLFIDDDVIAGPGLGAGHLAHHARRAGLVVVGYMPVVLRVERRPGEFASYLYAAEYEGRCRAYERDPGSILRTLWWGDVSIRREDARSVGLVAPEFVATYHEDQDFGLRCAEAGLSGVFDRTLRARHLHDRGLTAFVRDAQSQGAGRALVHQRHPETMGPLAPSEFETGLPGPAARVVRAARHRTVARAASATLTVIVRASGRLRRYRVETDAARLLRRVNQRYGAEAAWRAPARRHRGGRRRDVAAVGNDR
jgi:GT2 family glycosyltransferase